MDARSNTSARRSLEQAIFRFFTNTSSEPEAFQQFCDLLGTRYDLLAYLFFLKDWTRFMPIAPTTFDRAFKLFDLDLVMSHQCSWENYVRYNNTLAQIQTLLRDVAGVGDARLLDAHSFCWMLARLKLPAATSPTTIPLPQLLSTILPPTQPADRATGQRTAFPIVTDEDFAALDARRRRLGRLAQDVALKSEQRRLRELGNSNPANAAPPVWNEAGRGFDIFSCEIDGAPRHIEVKAARRSGSRLSFFLGRNEWRQSRELPNYWFYLVFAAESPSPEVLMVPASELSEASLVPTDYMASFQVSTA